MTLDEFLHCSELQLSCLENGHDPACFLPLKVPGTQWVPAKWGRCDDPSYGLGVPFSGLSQWAPSPGPWVPSSPAINQSMLLCHFYGHLSAPATACHRQGTMQSLRCHPPGGGGVLATPCPPCEHRLLHPVSQLSDVGTPAAPPHPQGTPFILTPEPSASPGAPHQDWGPRDPAGSPSAPTARPPPLLPLRWLALTTSGHSPASISSGQGLLFK